MSGFMFGGSALTLDIGVVNETGAAVTEGMVLAIELDSGTADDNDGFRAKIPVKADGNPEMFVACHGAALVPPGQSIADGDNLIVRVVGPCRVRVDAASPNVALGDVLIIANGSTDLKKPNALPALATGATGGYTQSQIQSLLDMHAVKAVSRQSPTATTDNALIDAWMKGL